MKSEQANARIAMRLGWYLAVLLSAIAVNRMLWKFDVVLSVRAQEAQISENIPNEVSAFIRSGRALPLMPGGAINYNDGLDGKAEFLLQTTFGNESDPSESRWFEEDVDVEQSPVIPFDGVGWKHNECRPSYEELSVNAILTEVDITPTEAIVVGLAATVLTAPLTAGWSLFIGAAAVAVTALPGNDSLGGASAQVPSNGTVVLEFRGPDGAAEVPVEGSSVPTPTSVETECALPELAAGAQLSSPASSDGLLESLSSPDEQAEGVFGPLDHVLRLSGEANYEPGLGLQAPEAQIGDVRRALGAMVVRLGQIAATLMVETSSDPEQSKVAAASVERGHSLAIERDWDAALNEYRGAFALAASAPREVGWSSPLRKESLLVPELVVTSPVRDITVAGYVTGLSQGETIKYVEVEAADTGEILEIEQPTIYDDRTFAFIVKVRNITVDPVTPIRVSVPVVTEVSSGETATSQLTLVIYPQALD